MRSAAWVIGGLILALALTLIAPFASRYADGLNKFATTQGFIGKAQSAPFKLLPNYTIPGLHTSGLTTILAGMLGVLIVFTVALLLARLSKRSSDHAAP